MSSQLRPDPRKANLETLSLSDPERYLSGLLRSKNPNAGRFMIDQGLRYARKCHFHNMLAMMARQEAYWRAKSKR